MGSGLRAVTAYAVWRGVESRSASLTAAGGRGAWSDESSAMALGAEVRAAGGEPG